MAGLTAASMMQAGAYFVQVAKRTAAGYPVGTVADPETITANTTSSALFVGSLDSFTPPVPTTEFAVDRGGQAVRGSMALGNSDFGSATIQLSEFNETLNALIKDAAVDLTSVVGWASSPANVAQKHFPRTVTMVTGRAWSDTDGADYWLTWVFHNCQWMEASGGGTSQASGVNPNPVSYTLNLSKSSKFFTGVAFSETAGQYVVGGTDAWTKIRSRYPLALTTYVADGSATTFILGYRPYYSTVTTGNNDNSFTKNGVATAPTSCVTSTGVVTIAAAGDSGDVHVAVYPTEFTAI